MMNATILEREWKADLARVERELEHLLDTDAAPATSVTEAMRYAVLGGGKRIRPLLALRVARMLGTHSALILRGAASVELLHCASLIVDDLPCMDDEQERRGKPAVHIAFGESTAILAAFGLVALAARCIIEHPEAAAYPQDVTRFQLALLRTLDAGGLIAGQELDLNLNGRQGPLERAAVNELKTVPLFELSVMAGMLAANLPPAAQDSLTCFGREFGRMFQQMDDHLDGDSHCEATLASRFDAVRRCLQQFPGDTSELEELLDYLHAKTLAQNCSHR